MILHSRVAAILAPVVSLASSEVSVTSTMCLAMAIPLGPASLSAATSSWLLEDEVSARTGLDLGKTASSSKSGKKETHPFALETSSKVSPEM